MACRYGLELLSRYIQETTCRQSGELLAGVPSAIPMGACATRIATCLAATLAAAMACLDAERSDEGFLLKDSSYRALSYFLSLAVLIQLALSRLLITGLHGCLFITLALRFLLVPELRHRVQGKSSSRLYVSQPDKATGSPSGFSLCIWASGDLHQQRIRRSKGIQLNSVLGMVAVSASFY